jgi:hypothetical protein
LQHLACFFSAETVVISKSLINPSHALPIPSPSFKDTATNSKVSGYYGPGPFISWLLTAISAIVTSIYCTTSDSAPSHLDTRGWSEHDKADAELLAAISYPLVASFDALARSFGEYDTRLSTAVYTVHTSFVFDFAAICLVHHRVDHPAPLRAAVWQLLWLLSFVTLMVSLYSTSAGFFWGPPRGGGSVGGYSRTIFESSRYPGEEGREDLGSRGT